MYLVGTAATWVLIDAGWANDGPTIRRAAAELFGSASRPAEILLTHVHPDHSGAALGLARTWDCPVYVHPDEIAQACGDFAAICAGGGPLDTWLILPVMRAMGRRRREAVLARASLEGVARPLAPAADVPGLDGWRWVHTPGHTPGHVSFHRPADGILITGDALVTLEVNSLSGLLVQRQGLSGPPWYTTWNGASARESVAVLAQLNARIVAGGHGSPLTGAGVPDAVRAFAARFAGHGAPENAGTKGTA